MVALLGLGLLNLFRQKKPANVTDVRQTVMKGGLLRVRPVMMTTLTTILALLPIMFFTSAGSEIIKPMASPIIGGLITATFTNLILVPTLYAWLKEKKVSRE